MATVIKKSVDMIAVARPITWLYMGAGQSHACIWVSANHILVYGCRPITCLYLGS